MTIETKYNIGDEVWYKGFPNIYQLKVIGIKIIMRSSLELIEYDVVEVDDDIPLGIQEILLFPTKEELLKSL